MVMTTKNFSVGENEKDINLRRCRVALSQLYKTLEECCITDNQDVKDAYVALQKIVEERVKE